MDYPSSLCGHDVRSYTFYMSKGGTLETPDYFRDFLPSLRVSEIAVNDVPAFLAFVSSHGGDITRLDATPSFVIPPDYAKAEELDFASVSAKILAIPEERTPENAALYNERYLFAKGFCAARWRKLEGSRYDNVEMKTILNFHEPVRLSSRVKDARHSVKVSHIFVASNNNLAYALSPHAHSGRSVDMCNLESVSYRI